MDLSKLPRLSKTDGPPPTESQIAPPARSPIPLPAELSGTYRPGLAEAWISIGVGVILLLVFPYTLQYFSSKLFHTPFAPFGDPDKPFPAKVDYEVWMQGGNTYRIYYRDTTKFWSDLVITAFALVLILDGILMVRFRKLPVVLFALCLTVAATLGNLIYLVKTYSQGLALTSALAVLFGGYIAMSQWSLARAMIQARTAPQRP
jgi:hypothetical protein